MRAAMIGRVVLTLATALVAGCYSPKLTNFGFACDSQAPKPCPDGYFCRNGFCDDGSGGTPPATGGNGADDMAMSQGGGGGGGGGGSAVGGGGGGGCGNQQQDMAMSVQDMAMPPADMAGQSGLCQCATMCNPGSKFCVGPNCCFEQAFLGACMPSSTCTPQMYP